MKPIKYIIIICMITMFYSCKKELDLIPENAISDGSFWKTENDFQLAANNFYWRLDEHARENDADLITGVVKNNISNGSYLPSDASDMWSGPYIGIRNTTYLIEKASTSPIKGNIQRYVGEALFFRALEYFRLVKAYGDVPLITTILDVDSKELLAPRIERTKVVDFILDELDKAIPLLPKQSELSPKELGRITSGAALALKARMGLYEGTWQRYHGSNINVDKYLTAAIEASNAVITSGEYKLYIDPTSPQDSFWRLYDYFGDDSKEVILASRYALNIRTASFSGDVCLWSPTKKLADIFLCTDGLPIDKSPLFQGYATMTSEFINRDPRMAQTILPPGTPHYRDNHFTLTPYYYVEMPRLCSGYINRKAYTQDLNAVRNWAKDVMDFKMIRYAEVLLIYAEAVFEKTGSISNADLNKSINVLRKRVGINMLDLTNESVTSNGLNMKTEIRRERTVELALEGFRLDDLKRWKTAETEMPMAMLGVKFQGTEYETFYSQFQVGRDIFVDANGFKIVEPASNRKFEQKHYLFPIPRVQLQLNPNLNPQNPGWD